MGYDLRPLDRIPHVFVDWHMRVFDKGPCFAWLHPISVVSCLSYFQQFATGRFHEVFVRSNFTKYVLTYLGVDFFIRSVAEEPAPRELKRTVDLFVDNRNGVQKVGNRRTLVGLGGPVPHDA